MHFKLEDTIYFFQNAKGDLRQFSINALDDKIVPADRATLKLDNKKNEWKGVYVYQEHNGD